MSDRELISLAWNVRDDAIGDDASFNRCYRVWGDLFLFLERDGVAAVQVEAELYDGFMHAWIILEDGRVLDPTADQFNNDVEKYPGVYLGPPLKFHPDEWQITEGKFITTLYLR
jgi:hypothetical protein